MVLVDLLGGLEKNSLQSLRHLNLGCCVPNQILDYDGSYWIERQQHLQSISLITDGACPTSSYVEYLDLKPFTSIQSLSWKGLNRGDHFDCLASFIKHRTGARRLRTLELDLVEWIRAENGWYDQQRATLGGLPPLPSNFFAVHILGIQPAQNSVLFQSLETLQLTGVAFSPFENELSSSFNITNLSTLQLRNCPASLELLGALLEQGTTLKLKSFELAIDWNCLHYYQDFDRAQEEVISRFLGSFQGLEDLFLLLTQPLEWYLIMNSIVNHESTLKRLVVHERDTPKGEVVDGGIPWHNSGDLLFHDSKVSCFGTGGPISEMRSSFAQLPTRPRCKILHIKASWVDLYKELEEELHNVDPEDSDFEDLEPYNLWSGQKFPSFPRAEIHNEASNSTQIHPSNHSSSFRLSGLFESHGLAIQEPEISTRTREIANRSNFSGPAQALLEFARWAFSPEGIPELQVLAWGDFCHDGRWSESNVLLCRDQSIELTGTNFRTLRDSDFGYWDLVDGNMDMLSACSPDHLLWANDGVLS